MLTANNNIIVSSTKMNVSQINESYLNYNSVPISYDYPVRDSLYIVIPLTVIYSLIFLTGMVGNVITCVVISRNKSMHTATNYYLFSLAVSDLLLLLSGKIFNLHIMIIFIISQFQKLISFFCNFSSIEKFFLDFP